MRPDTPYSKDLGDRDPVPAMREAVAKINAVASRWTPEQFERSYAPGKWSARRILIHLVQTEIALGNRARMALTIPDYTSQAFDQDRWMDREGSAAAGAVALQALVAMSTFNAAFFETLSPAQRAMPFSHPEYGALTVDWLLHQMAGHLVHHQRQIEEI
jgi:DinB family protein